MPPRGSGGYDFTPILTHYLFLFTTILALVGWFVAFIGQAVATAKFGNGAVGVLWFSIFLQLALILGVLHTLATDSIAMHRFQISIFGAIAIVFSVFGVNEGIFSSLGALDAMAAGWLILAIVNIIWVLYFTSEEDSLMLHVFNTFGTGGLTGPSRRGTRRHTRSSSGQHMQGNGGYGYGGGGGAGIGGGGISSTGVGGYEVKDPIGSRSGSLHHNAGMDNLGAGLGGGSGSRQNLGSPAPASLGAASGGAAAAGGAGPDSTPLISNAPIVTNPDTSAGPAGGDTGGESYLYRAKALYAYQASADDPNEISFSKGEILDILDKSGKWWQARKADGQSGIAPSNYLHII